MKRSITRVAAMSVVGLMVAVAAVFMAVPANAMSRPAVVSTQSAVERVTPAPPPDGFACVGYLKLFGYTITRARVVACGASYISKTACIGGLVATLVRPTIATPACFV